MAKNWFQTIARFIAGTLLYQPTPKQPRFVLDEAVGDDGAASPEQAVLQVVQEIKSLIRYGHRLESVRQQVAIMLQTEPDIHALPVIQQQINSLMAEWQEVKPLKLAYREALLPHERTISANLAENERVLGEIYQLPENKDLVLRHFTLPGEGGVKALLVFMDGIVDKNIINQGILRSLMVHSCQKTEASLLRQIREQCLPNSQEQLLKEFADIEQAINNGDAVLFLAGSDEALTIDARGGKRRAVSTPVTESAVRGSQEAFTEVLRVNTALVRSVLRTSDLVTAMHRLGKRGRLQCAVMYIASIANEQLVKEVHRRIESLSMAYITEAGGLMQLLIDHPNFWFPQTLSTERPDRVAANLVEGRVAILIEGNPFAQIVPISLFSLLQSPEDYSLPASYVTMIRYTRVIGALLTTFLPGVFIAISLFHQEALPTDLVLAIAAAREQVPFPAVVEIVLMMGSFELIREGGLRIPGLLGPTIGIVGAIILGQAAVMAKIVSPIMIIVVAVAGLASFILPEYRFGIALRMLSFLFLILGSVLGLVGIAVGIFVLTGLLSSMKSFGVPYLAPIAPKVQKGKDVLLKGQYFNQQSRPDELNTKDPIRQPDISRSWTDEDPAR
ncbi:MAG: spore germination protein [Sporomusaceae bacterium]|nr:spore germination protein [Sporomusaceae bacterium]